MKNIPQKQADVEQFIQNGRKRRQENQARNRQLQRDSGCSIFRGHADPIDVTLNPNPLVEDPHLEIKVGAISLCTPAVHGLKLYVQPWTLSVSDTVDTEDMKDMVEPELKIKSDAFGNAIPTETNLVFYKRDPIIPSNLPRPTEAEKKDGWMFRSYPEKGIYVCYREMPKDNIEVKFLHITQGERIVNLGTCRLVPNSIKMFDVCNQHCSACNKMNLHILDICMCKMSLKSFS